MNLDSLLNIGLEAINAGAKAILEIKSASKNMQVWKKENNTPLSEADIAANTAITEILSKTKIPICSEEKPLEYDIRKDLESFWLIDPLDGTKGFIEGSENYCVLIALIAKDLDFNKESRFNGYFATRPALFRPTLALIAKPESSEIYYAHAKSPLYKNDKIFTPKMCKDSIALVSKHHGSPLDTNFLKENNLKSLSIPSALKFIALLNGAASVYHRFENLNSWDIAAGDFLINHSGGFMADLHLNPINYNTQSFRCPYFIALDSKSRLDSLKIPSVD